MEFIIGILLWQTITVIAMVLSKEDDDIYVPIAMGIWTPIIWIVKKVYSKVAMLISRRYNCYAVYGDYEWLTNVYMTPKTARLFRSVDKSGHHHFAIKLEQSGKDFKSPVPKKLIVTEKDYRAIGPASLAVKLLEDTRKNSP